MYTFLYWLTESYEVRALAASVLVGIVCGVLGCFIVLRNMALIGDALSHAILPGVVVGYMLAGNSPPAMFLGAVGAGLLTALAITWLQRNVRGKEDAVIGIVFSAMFAWGVIGISQLTRREGVHLDLKDFLFGNLLGVGDQDLWLTSIITVFVLVSVVLFYRYFFITTFQPTVAVTMGIRAGLLHYFLMLLLSFAVVAALQTVGVILVVAMLVIPASTALLLVRRLPPMLVVSAILGAASAVVGLYVAIRFDTAPGPAMTVVAFGFYVLAAAFAPRRGLLVRYRMRRFKKLRILAEDVLKELGEATQVLSEAALAEALKTPLPTLRRALRHLRRQGRLVADGLTLTDKGADEARRLIRAHRVVESYLIRTLGQDEARAHDSAERYEHYLPEELVHAFEATLGAPLTTLAAGETALPVLPQPDADAARRLAEMGLGDATRLEITATDAAFVEVRVNGRTYQLPHDLAARLLVTKA